MTAAELAQFRAWLQSEPAHEAAFAEARMVWRDVELVRQEFEPSCWAAKTVQATRADDPEHEPSPKIRHHHTPQWKRWRPLAVTNGLIAVAVLVFVVLLVDLPVFFLAEYRTGSGEQASFTLPDGSVVHINTDSALSVDYSSQFRLVRLLRGEAVFEVVPNPALPFRVSAQSGTIEAVGTVFAVRVAERAVTVTVTTGAVDVMVPRELPNVPTETVAQTTRVERGQQLTYGRNGEMGALRTVDATVATAWRNGKIIFEGKPFAEALAEFDRYQPGWLLVLADVSSTRLVSGVFTIDRLDDGVAALAATQGLTAMRLSRYLTIVR